MHIRGCGTCTLHAAALGEFGAENGSEIRAGCRCGVEAQFQRQSRSLPAQRLAGRVGRDNSGVEYDT